jgi:hypothetical protein
VLTPFSQTNDAKAAWRGGFLGLGKRIIQVFLRFFSEKEECNSIPQTDEQKAALAGGFCRLGRGIVQAFKGFCILLFNN